MKQANNTLISKLENFIKKYYQNQLLKGAILGISLLLVAFFTLAFLEYFARFSPNTRTTLFYIYLVICLSVFGWYIVRPILGLFNISRKFGIKQASVLVGNHFPTVKDKLLNTLQLQSDAKHQQNNALLLASIEQKTNELKPIPFIRAISFKKNFRYVKFALVPALALLFILIVSPGFKNSSMRVVNFNKHFEIEAPFIFNTNLDGGESAVQNQDIDVTLNLNGDEIPKEAYINFGNQRYKMKSQKIGAFQFKIKNIQKSEKVVFESAGFSSKEFEINVSLRPSLVGYDAKITYPKYLQIESESIRNTSEFNIPQGSIIEWSFKTKNVERIRVSENEKEVKLKDKELAFRKRFMKTSRVKVSTINEEVSSGDSLQFQVNVIPDHHPQIEVERKNDSLSNKVFYFLGEISDDHGFVNLQFHYKFKSSNNADKVGTKGSSNIAIDPALNNQNFYYYWNLGALDFELEDEIEYYFTIWDNDGVNGSKPTRTATKTYKAPSLKEIEQQTEKANEQIKSSLSGAQSEATKLEKELNAIEKMLTEKKNLDWNDKKKIQDLLNKQKDLEEKIRKAVNQNLEKNLKEEEFKPMDESLLQKQKELEKLLDDVLDDETKALMEKIQKLLEENKKEELQQAIEDFKFSEKEMSKEMDRMLELFKELELEKKLNETIIKLNELAKKQKDLAAETKAKKKSNEDLAKKQDELNQEMKDLKKDLEDIDKKNKALESPLGLKDKKEKHNSTSQKMQSGEEKAKKGKNKAAAEEMDEAAEDLQEMAEEMQAEMEDSYEEQQEEDYNNLRQILENLIQLSHDQEKIMDGFKENRRYSPKYIELRQKQRKIKDETKMVEDSLLALSKRNMSIEHFVNEEIARVNESLDKSLSYLGERYTSNALVHQQYAMTGYNNLALMLSKSLENMQNQMKSMKENKGKPKSQCKKPGSSKGGKPKKSNANAIKKMQQELAKQLEQMKQGKKQGKNPNSKEFAKMAAQQEAIRKKLQDLERSLKKEGKGGSLGDLKKTQDLMDELEKDLYYKRLNNSTFQKLDLIDIKLSEHEKAEREQDQDNKRTSNEGDQINRNLPPSIKDYLDKKNKETELLQSVSPELKIYYKNKVKEYFSK